MRVGSEGQFGAGSGGHLGVGSAGPSRSLKCVSVVGSVKNSVLVPKSEPADNISDHDDSYNDDDTYMDMATQNINTFQGGK